MYSTGLATPRCDACVPPGFARGRDGVWSGRLARVSLWVGLVLRLVCEVLVSVSCVSRLPPVSLNRSKTGGSRDTHEGEQRGREPDGFYKYVIRFCLV